MSLLEDEPSSRPGEAEPVYVVMQTAANGWVLLARHPDSRVFVWTPLVGRGASSTATPQVALAVAVRVLTGWGVAVHGWASTDESHEHSAELADAPEHHHPRFRAVLTGNGRRS